MNGTDEKTFRNTVVYTSFILTVLVIYIHSPNMTEPLAAASGSAGAFCFRVEQFIVNVGQIAVPGFFLLSGFLFFRKMPAAVSAEAGTAAGRPAAAARYFGRQYRKKACSLLLPYLVWNTFYMLIYFLFLKEPVTVQNLVQGIFFYRYNPVFWYMKQLILLTLLTPLIWLLVKKRCAAVPVLAGLFLLAANYTVVPVHPVNEDALFYFAAGAAAGLHAEGLPQRAFRGTVIVLFLACFLFYRYGGLYTVIGLRVLAPAALFLILSGLKAVRKDPPGFMQINFFIYAFHFLIVRSSTRLVRALWGERPAALLAVFLVMPLLAVSISYAVSLFLKKYLPRLRRVLTGGR